MKTLLLPFVFSVVSVCALAASALACPLKSSAAPLMATSPVHVVAATPSPPSIKVGQPFSVILTACDLAGMPFKGAIKPDAVMPAHKHGMNYRPSISSMGDGRYKVDGFLFHMPGRWQFIFELRNGQITDRIRIDHTIK